MSVLTICPRPLRLRSKSANMIPRAQGRPPPAKSARRLRGKDGLSGRPGSIWNWRLNGTFRTFIIMLHTNREDTTLCQVVNVMAYIYVKRLEIRRVRWDYQLDPCAFLKHVKFQQLTITEKQAPSRGNLKQNV